MNGTKISTGKKNAFHPGRTTVLVLALLALFLRVDVSASKIEYYDPFEVMDEVRRLETKPLWPGFNPGEIPVGLYDGKQTYLFGFPKIPDGFKPVENRAGVLIFNGPHPAVFGNLRNQIEGVWIATSIPVHRSEFTGHSISLTEIAGVVIHEKFHVFQAIRHPDWKPNDAVLLVYPVDTEASLKARSLELEALRRAVLATDPEASSWAKTALVLRRDRLAGLGNNLILYERESQRLEGIAEYIEYKAAERPVAGGPLPVGFAPKSIREMGYIEGRWIAVLLDRFDPGWKDDFEETGIIYLEDRLDEVLRKGPAPAAFTSEEEARWSMSVQEAMTKNDIDRRKMLRDLNGKLGITIIIEARGRPLRFKMFDPFTLEAVGPLALLHSQWLSLKSDQGAIDVIGMTVLTETDQYGRVIRLFISGLARRPRLLPSQKSIRYQSDGFFLSLRSIRLHPRGFYTYVIELI